MKPMQHEQGQVLVEFALTALILFTMVVFVMDGSRIFWNYLTVSEAARVGARYAIVHGALATTKVGPSNYAALTNEIRSKVVGLTPANLTVAPTWPAGNAPGSSVTVVVTYPVRPITRLFWPGQTFNLSAQSTMVIQN
jgi:Flp pilus assembly protein TadG